MNDIENEAVGHIAERLTGPQKRAMVMSLMHYGNQDQVLVVGGGEHTVRALQQGSYPLADQDGMTRFLTPLGRAVARHLNRSGEWDLPTWQEPVLEAA